MLEAFEEFEWRQTGEPEPRHFVEGRSRLDEHAGTAGGLAHNDPIGRHARGARLNAFQNQADLGSFNAFRE